MKDFVTLKKMAYQMYHILDASQRREMVGMYFIILIGALLELLGVSAIMPFINALLNPAELVRKPLISDLFSFFHLPQDRVLLVIGIGIVIIYLIKNAYLLFSSYMQAMYGNKTKKNLSSLLMKSYMNRPYSFFSNSNSGEIINSVIQDANAVYVFILNLFKFLSEGTVVLLIAAYLAVTDLYMSLGILVVGGFCSIGIVLFIKRYMSKLGRIVRATGIESNKWIVQIVEGIKDIFVFDKRESFYENYSQAYNENTKASAAQAFVQTCPERIIEFFCVSGLIITVLIRISSEGDASLFVPKMAAFAMAAFRLLPSISRITGYVSYFIFARPAIEASYNSICESREQLKRNDEVAIDKDEGGCVDFAKSIEVDHISWHYDSNTEDVLQDLSIIIQKGESVGIIGESGSGKSTFGDILLNLYHPQKGVIYMDGLDISKIPYSWHRVIGYVPQNVFLMDATIRENVAFGESNPEDERVWKALDQASLKDYVRTLSDGLDTIVGERGIKFSGGQRQRIAIARALYFEPEILLLDEATSALDNDTETAVMEAIDTLKGTMTLIIIAHRLTTIKNCDRVIEIVDGKAVPRSKEEVLREAVK